MGRGRSLTSPGTTVLVIGQSASGKSTVARAIAERRGLAHIELDALFHGEGWVQRESFVEDVDVATADPGWVVDGNYPAVRDLLWGRADTVVWLDLPRRTVVRRALLRTARRLLVRAELWNGNRERLSTVLRASHPIRWTWSTFAAHRAGYESRWSDPQWAGLTKARLRTPAEVREWLRSC